MSDSRRDSAVSTKSSPASPYNHYDSVRDAVTKGPVQDLTDVAALHTYGDDPEGDLFLKNLTRVAEPAVPCQIKVGDGEWLPATTQGHEDGYQLSVTYNHLMFAPQLRLECRFLDGTHKVYHVAVLEFPFAAGDGTAISNYCKSEGESQITFTANGATSTGLGNIQRSRFHLQRPERRILSCLTALCTPTPASVDIRLDLSSLADGQRSCLTEIDEILPGGSGPLLRSFSKPEYFALDDKASFSISKEFLKNPNDLMKAEVRFPMVALAPQETFRTPRQAALHLGYAAYHAELEVSTAVRAWATSTHKAAMFRIAQYDIPVLAVRFAKDFTRLSGPREEVKFKLPHELRTLAMFSGDRDEERTRELVLVLDEVSGLPRHDAAFLILNEGGFPWLQEQDKVVYKSDSPYPEFVDIDFDPRMDSPTLNAFMATANKLHDRSQSWIPHLLNQNTSQLQEVDLTDGVEPELVREADQWLFGWRDWNPEQRQVLESIHHAKGKMVITKGPAGTGKTTVQSAVALYFAKLGFKVLVAPPSNSNASHTALDMNEASAADDVDECMLALSLCEASEDGETQGVYTPSATSSDVGEAPTCDASAHGDDENDIHFMDITTPRNAKPVTRRLFASSLSQTLEQFLQKEAQTSSTRFNRDSPSTTAPLAFILQCLNDRKAGSRDHAVEQAVIDEAARKRFKMLGKSEFGDIKPENDVWDLFRKHLQAAREGTFSWSDKMLRKEFAKVYELCRGHVVAASDVLVTTTGNARNTEILEHWLRSEEDYGIPSKGVIVLLDEAYKDSELGTWNAILAPGEKTKGVFMFGDEFQLKPTNVTSKGKLVLGQFGEQLDIALPARLVKHGFPYVYLKQQQRMHPCLSKFPNAEFYEGMLRDGPRVHATLDSVMPGLNDILHRIIYKSYSTFKTGLSADHYWKNRTDEKARHHYIEVQGQRRSGHDGTSKYVQEHIDVFSKYIFPALQEYWRGETSKNLMIICAYTAAKVRYRAAIERLQLEQELPASWYPSIDEIASDADSTSNGSSPSGRSTPNLPATNGGKKRNPETAYSRYLTIDAAQGQESFMVVMDASMQQRDDVGFMTDRGRCNVAMTRAKGVFWVIGGALDLKNQRNRPKALSPFPKLKRQMAREGKVHRIKL